MPRHGTSAYPRARLFDRFARHFATAATKPRRAQPRAAALMGVLAGLLCCSTVQGELPNQGTMVGLSGSVVRVEASKATGGLSVGTGVTVARSVVVTNCHVVRNAAIVRISGSGRLWDATGEFADLLHDLCFLRVPEWKGKPVALGSSEMLRPGERVAALGYTGGSALSFRFGRIVALHSLEAGRVIESDAAFTSGASGGGLFDARGELVGLLTFRSREPRGNYYALPAEWIRERLPTEDQWSDVRPLQGAEAFWQGDAGTLPNFMRVALLETEGRWAALLDLADRWSEASPGDAEPLLARARALQQLERPRAAARAFRGALSLAPDDPAAWYGLALAYALIGDDLSLRGARARLDALDEGLSATLASRLRELEAAK